MWTDDRISDGVRAAAGRSLDALYGLACEADEDGDDRPVVVELGPAARGRVRRFVNEWGARQFEADGDLAAAMSKLEALAGRFALIHHVTARAPDLADTDPIGAGSLEAGIRLAEWFCHEAAGCTRSSTSPRSSGPRWSAIPSTSSSNWPRWRSPERCSRRF